MFAAIRKKLWPANCMQRAKESVAGKVRNKSAKLAITKEFPEDYHVRKMMEPMRTTVAF